MADCIWCIYVYIDRLDCTFCVYHMRMHTVREEITRYIWMACIETPRVRGKETRCTVSPVSTYWVHLYPSDISTLEAFLRTVQTTTTTSISIGTTLSVSVVSYRSFDDTVLLPANPGIVSFSFGNNGERAHRKKREEALDLIYSAVEHAERIDRVSLSRGRESIRIRYEKVFFLFFFMCLCEILWKLEKLQLYRITLYIREMISFDWNYFCKNSIILI